MLDANIDTEAGGLRVANSDSGKRPYVKLSYHSRACGRAAKLAQNDPQKVTVDGVNAFVRSIKAKQRSQCSSISLEAVERQRSCQLCSATAESHTGIREKPRQQHKKMDEQDSSKNFAIN